MIRTEPAAPSGASFEDSEEVMTDYERGVRDGRAYMRDLKDSISEQWSMAQEVAKLRDAIQGPLLMICLALGAIAGALIFK